MVANIEATYYAAKQYPSLWMSGLDWYDRAHAQASAIAARQRVSLPVTAGIIAALSPRNPWERNLIDAENCLKAIAVGKAANDFKVATFDRNKDKAIAIAKGADPLSVLSPLKTGCFYQNLINPADPATVTVDGHAALVALNRLLDANSSVKMSKFLYQTIADAYRQATLEINADSLESDILPSQCQAVCWVYVRVLKGIDKTFDIE